MKIIAKLDIIGTNWTYYAVYFNSGTQQSVSGHYPISSAEYAEEKLAIEYEIVSQINQATGDVLASVNDIVWI